MELSERRRKILRVVVENYIETAEPIGSKAIAEKAALTCSSATIRNELAALEKQGYLEQPHTSAGRIPSPLGYRFYVNELMEAHKLSLQETERINEAMNNKMQELDRVIDQAGRLVSQMTNYPAFSLTAGGSEITITRYDLLMVDSSSFIAVVMTSTNAVKNKLIHLPTKGSGIVLRADLSGGLLCHGCAGRLEPGRDPYLRRGTPAGESGISGHR